jgi:hypothetical protein
MFQDIAVSKLANAVASNEREDIGVADTVGIRVGRLVGAIVGENDGPIRDRVEANDGAVVGTRVGKLVGANDGPVGDAVGDDDVGIRVGKLVGDSVGAIDGPVGVAVGDCDGTAVGIQLGNDDGIAVGIRLGSNAFTDVGDPNVTPAQIATPTEARAIGTVMYTQYGSFSNDMLLL